MRSKFSLSEVSALYAELQSTSKVAERLGLSQAAVAKRLRKAGIALRSPGPPEGNSNGRKWELDHNFFSVVASEEAAYFLGLLCADGWVYGNTVGIELVAADRQLLEQFAAALRTQLPVRTRSRIGKRPSAYLAVNSKKLVADLAAMGVAERKSLTQGFPAIDAAHVRHFVRGYFDGDGSAYISRGYKHASFCGTTAFLEALRGVLKTSAFIVGGSIVAHRSIFKLVLVGKDAEALARWMYEGASISLSRKESILCA